MTDVLVGDVWVASGQSNMEWPMKATNDAESEIAAADWPEIRFVDVPNVVAATPRRFVQVGRLAALQAGEHRRLLGRGLLLRPRPAQGTERADRADRLQLGRHADGSVDEPRGARVERHVQGRRSPEADNEPTTDEEKKHRKDRPHDQPASLFNGMLSAVIPYGIRGAIWYQGESNAGRHEQYAELSKLMIADWRNRWGQGDFPFLLVQLAAFEPGGDIWPPLREAQTETLEVAERRHGGDDRHRRPEGHSPAQQARRRQAAGPGRAEGRLRRGHRLLRSDVQGD